MLPLDKSHTAILVFIRSAKVEALAKPLSPFRNKAPKLAQLMNERVIQLAQASDLPFYIVDEKIQQGSDFSTRLDSAFQFVFAQGHQNVIAIGNDCFELSTADLLVAQQQLENKQLVLGPALDGGVYLLGMSNQVFQQLNFAQLAWQQSNLFQQIQDTALKHKWTLATLNWAKDIDNVQILSQVLRTLKKLDFFLRAITQLLLTIKLFVLEPILDYATTNVRSIALRGPPLPLNY